MGVQPDPRIGPEAAPIELHAETAIGANGAWLPTLHGTGTEDYFNAVWAPRSRSAFEGQKDSRSVDLDPSGLVRP
ncbi:MAG: DUF2961 domain-containing protein [Rhizobiaceae bacterium]|nr:DUF2961 domain-containing protein [Rhizobiaceae bacterium]